MTQYELTACPFCGGEAKLTKTVEEYPADGVHPAGEYEAWFHIGCSNCGIEMGDEYRSGVIECWNTRALRSAAPMPEDAA